MITKQKINDILIKITPYCAWTGLISVVCALFFWKSIFISIYPGELGVKYARFTGGTELNKVFQEGLHIMWPFNIMYIYNVRIIEFKKIYIIPTANGLPVELKVSCQYQIDAKELPSFHQQVGPNYEEKIIFPLVASVVRETVGSLSAELLYQTKRQSLGDDMVIKTITGLGRMPVTIHKISVEEIVFPVQFTKAIVNKMIALEEYEKYKYIILAEKEEAKRKYIEGLGIQKYQELINKGMTDNFLSYRGIEATKELSGSDNSKVVLIGNSKNGLPLIFNAEESNANSTNNNQSETALNSINEDNALPQKIDSQASQALSTKTADTQAVKTSPAHLKASNKHSQLERQEGEESNNTMLNEWNKFIDSLNSIRKAVIIPGNPQ